MKRTTYKVLVPAVLLLIMLWVPFLQAEAGNGSLSGYVVSTKNNLMDSVKLKLRGKRTNIRMTTFSNASGFFKFTDLDRDTYILTAQKRGYKKEKQKKHVLCECYYTTLFVMSKK